MKIVKGDLINMAIDGKFDVIIHGCNCFNTMEAGIAATIRAVFPKAWDIDQRTKKGDISKLGEYTAAKILYGKFTFYVVNAYTQFGYNNKNGIDLSYVALKKVLRKIAKNYDGLKIGYPKIGCGLAGGDWKRVSAIIDQEFEGQDHTYVEFKG